MNNTKLYFEKIMICKSVLNNLIQKKYVKPKLKLKTGIKNNKTVLLITFLNKSWNMNMNI